MDPFLRVTLSGLTPLRELEHDAQEQGKKPRWSGNITAWLEMASDPPYLPASTELGVIILGEAVDVFQVFNKELCTHVHGTAENFCNYSNFNETTSALSLPSSHCFSLYSLLVISHCNCKKCFVQIQTPCSECHSAISRNGISNKMLGICLMNSFFFAHARLWKADIYLLSAHFPLKPLEHKRKGSQKVKKRDL